jgi:flagellar hook-basal body complex protein FliE
MVVTPLSLGSLAGAASAGLAGSTGIAGSTAAAGDFAGTLGSAIQKVNELQATAEQKVTGLLSGGGQDVHTAALSVERASLGFDLMLQVRNKVVGAYQEISKLQF